MILYKNVRKNTNICYIWEENCYWLWLPFIIKIDDNNYLIDKQIFDGFLRLFKSKYDYKLNYLYLLFYNKKYNLAYVKT